MLRKCLPLLPLLLLTLLISTATPADEFDFGETGEEKSGFWVPIRGNFSTETAYQVGNAPRWQRLGLFSNLILDWDTPIGLWFANVNGRVNTSYRIEGDPQSVLDDFEWVGIFREGFWSKSFGPFSLTLGNRIVVWGKADALVITDVVSPRDQTAFFFARPGETRLGQNMVKLDYFHQGFQAELIFVPYTFHNRIATGFHPYSIAPGIILEDREWDRRPELGGRVQYTFSRFELSLLGGYFHQRNPNIDQRGYFEATYERRGIAGLTASLALDPFLIKTEAAYQHQLAYQSFLFGTIPNGSLKINTLSAMLGFDYVHSLLGTFIVEGSIVHPNETLISVPQSVNGYSLALGWSDTYLSDDLTASVFGFFFNRFGNFVGRFSLGYQLNDSWSLSSQVTLITADATDANFAPAANFDRVGFTVDYQFDLGK